MSASGCPLSLVRGRFGDGHAGLEQCWFMQAVKNMMAAALEEPRNQRFLLLSESCAPLYPPAVVYQQACPN